MPPDTRERTTPQPQPERPVLDLLTPDGQKTELILAMYTDAAVNGGGGGDMLQSTTGRKVKVVRLRQQPSTEDQRATEF